MNVTGPALSEILDVGLKAYRDAGVIRIALDDIQTTLQTSQRYRTLFVDETYCCCLTVLNHCEVTGIITERCKGSARLRHLPGELHA